MFDFAYSRRGGSPDSNTRCCDDCGHVFGLVNLWCGSDEAVEFRKTQIPGCIGCKFWKPMKRARWWHYLDISTLIVKLESR